MFFEMDHPTIGKIKTIGFSTKLSRTPGKLDLPSPLLEVA
jgi:formyl-CoA transferase